MKKTFIFTILLSVLIGVCEVKSQIGTRFPSERKVVKDSVTGVDLIFLTSTPAGDSKIYPTHPQWSADGNWLIFRSNRVKGEAMAVNESTGDIIQVTEGGYDGMLTLARKEMRLYYMRKLDVGDMEVVSIDLAKLFADSMTKKLKTKSVYETIHGIVPKAIGNGGDMALDAEENQIYFKTNKEESAKHLAENVSIEPIFGPRNMGAGPGGIASMDLKSGEISHVVSVPFQVGHVQTNPWAANEIIFCWETGGKSPQRTWTVLADGTGLRPLYPESEYEWVTHEAVISKDEVAMAIMGHRPVDFGTENPNESSAANPGQETSWGPSGTREKPTGLAIVNIRTREMRIEGQTESGSGLWHVHGSPDGRWAVGDDFSRTIYLIDRNTKEMKMLSTGHKTTAADHPHPTFSPDGTKIQIQSAMLSEDDRSMNICIVSVPEHWLKRTYDQVFQ
ncbi:hypothetical protein P872_16975 [Rhodonellum psychrophilum GCM71 = DSM 17998]|uniref:Oligogalacturonate lyase domain-containing protein n=2 Tax=Rhodonellum TaxID=336827 RepID=U5C2R7_9BACT|nr:MULTISPECIES: PD40 domain-containing protein [Rhodonellum]ERM83216.1 hypothetical protein P872_16975 [Rhodonellum psychrophilum GCM71 = DSM 17998]SDZ14139.1 oligogalacturonide lyase [Rhodonellum ikkaensis]